jgi:hypothetical protein
VDDHVVEVEEYPSRTGVALAPPHLDAMGCQALIKCVDYRVHLALAEHSSNHKPVGKAGDLADIDDGDILRQSLGQFVDNFLNKLISFQRITLPGEAPDSVSKRA